MRILLAAIAVAALAAPAHADGLRIGTGLSAMTYKTGDVNTNVYVASTSARVQRGRASLSFNAPIIGVSGGRVSLATDVAQVEATSQQNPLRFGVGDMSVGLDYNVFQNREKMIIVALGGSLRFPTNSMGSQFGSNEDFASLGLNGIYGITRQLLAYADLRQTWVGAIKAATATRIRAGELGAVYWLTDGVGFTASMSVTDFGERALVSNSGVAGDRFAVDFNAGMLVEVLPGMMMNLGGMGGLTRAAPQAGGSFGFGFEI